MKNILRHIFSKPYSLLIAAGLVFALSFLFKSQYSERTSISREWKRLEGYLHRQEQSFLNLLRDTPLVRRLIAQEVNIGDIRNLGDRSYGVYLYRKSPGNDPRLAFWSNQLVLPAASSDTLEEGAFFQKYSNGYYLAIKRKIRNVVVDTVNVEEDSINVVEDTIIAYGLIPIFYKYFLESDYLPDEFAYGRNASNKIQIVDYATEYPVKSLSGATQFYLVGKNYAPVSTANKISVWLKIVAVIFLLLFIHLMAESVSRRYNVWLGIAFMVVIVFALRLVSYYFPFPVNLRQFELFDPAVYGANPVQKSLGDLLINAILFCWVVLFVWSKMRKDGTAFLYRGKKKPYWVGVLATIGLVFTTFMAAFIIRSLAADSNISFDVTNFFSLDKFSVFGFIALSIITIAYYYFSRIIIQFIKAAFLDNFIWVYFIVAIAGLAYLTFIFISPETRFFIFVLAWLLVYVWLMQQPRLAINRLRVNVTSAIFWMFIFSVSITVVIIGANREKEWEIRKKLASKLDVQSDPMNARSLNIELTYIDEDFLRENFHRFSNPVTGSDLRDSILKKGRYLSKYDTRLYVFDSAGRAVFNDDNESFNTLNSILEVQSQLTNIKNLYYYETSFDKFTFVFKREVRDTSGAYKGSLFIVLNPEAYTKDDITYELFRQSDQSDAEESPIYSYAIYKKNKLVSPVKKYAFATSLTQEEVPYDEFEKRVNGDNDELWYKASQEKVVVIAKKRDSAIEAITLFSYIFCVFLFLVMIMGLFFLLARAGFSRQPFFTLVQMNIRSQVHSTIIFISLLSFMIIGVATISFFITRYKRNNEEKLGRTMEVMVNEMQKRLDQRSIFDDVLQVYDSAANRELTQLVNDVADVHNVDVNVYDTTGDLQVSSQPIIYREGYLSMKMHPEAYYFLNKMRRGQHIQQEKMVNFSYLSIYASVRNDEGDVKAYLNIPYFLSQQELNQEISNFLVTIINLNAFIFLIAGIIALFITNRITHSFSLIGEKMKEINLGRANEEIAWNRDDEIGELVKEYNKMVNKLEESAAALARSEREGAWREMARQVAHEIKNPLTPMKLSIQYLQKSISNNSVNVKELTSNVARTLVEQIDHLSKIAADFSQFANIGNTNPEVFDLNEVFLSLRELYQSNPDVQLDLNTLPGRILMQTDKTQMNRLFTNLLQNAIEACNGKDRCRIIMNVARVNGHVRVSVSDNGQGIPVEMQSKIFVPNFTTKSSGTGLGLAMCKGIVEQAGGSIWFETIQEKGTTFFVELPSIN